MYLHQVLQTKVISEISLPIKMQTLSTKKRATCSFYQILTPDGHEAGEEYCSVVVKQVGEPGVGTAGV